jgi:hypothetical protein
MYPNMLPSEQVACLGDIAPISQGVGAVTTGWISMANVGAILAEIKTGVLGTAATVDAKIQQATSNAGANAKDITGKAITQIVKATGDNKTAFINVSADELDVNGGFTHVQLSITVGAAASLVAGTVLGCKPRNFPASALNDADVVQVVN